MIAQLKIPPMTPQEYLEWEEQQPIKYEYINVADILEDTVYQKKISFTKVLMDSWYAAQKLMKLIENLGKIYYVPLKKNRLVDDTGGQQKYQHIEQLTWSQLEQEQGKLIKINRFPREKKAQIYLAF
jgi:hypothetical protein